MKDEPKKPAAADRPVSVRIKCCSKLALVVKWNKMKENIVAVTHKKTVQFFLKNQQNCQHMKKFITQNLFCENTIFVFFLGSSCMREETHIDGTSTGSCKAGEGIYCTVCSLVRMCTKLYYFTFSSHVRCKTFLIIYW